MSAFQNIIDLRFAVSDHVGNRAISDVFSRLVEMAENDFNSRLRVRQQIRDAMLSFDEGICPLPIDYLELVSVAYRPGMSREYQVDGFNIAIPGFSGDVGAQYYAKLPSLTCSPTASNWLLARYPNVYLYGVGLQAAKHLKDMELAVATSSMYGEAIKLLQIDDERARWAGSSIRVRGLTP